MFLRSISMMSSMIMIIGEVGRNKDKVESADDDTL
jgi:hypothetical protein